MLKLLFTLDFIHLIKVIILVIPGSLFLLQFFNQNCCLLLHNQHKLRSSYFLFCQSTPGLTEGRCWLTNTVFTEIDSWSLELFLSPIVFNYLNIKYSFIYVVVHQKIVYKDVFLNFHTHILHIYFTIFYPLFL